MNEPEKDVATKAADLEMVEVTLDGKTVSVSKEAVDILNAKEHDIVSRNDKILAEKRQELDTFREKVQNDLDTDLNFYEDHPDEADWLYYKSLSKGGDGSCNIPEGAQTVDTVQKPAQNAFETNPDIDAMKKEIDSVKTTMAENAKQREDAARQSVITARDEILPHCVYVDEEIATSLLSSFFTKNQRHATKPEIASIIKGVEGKMATIADKKAEAIVNAKFNPQSSMPQPGGQSPLPEGTEIPKNFDDMDALIKIAHDMNTTVG